MGKVYNWTELRWLLHKVLIPFDEAVVLKCGEKYFHITGYKSIPNEEKGADDRFIEIEEIEKLTLEETGSLIKDFADNLLKGNEK